MNYALTFEQRSEYLYVYVEVYVATYEVTHEYCTKIAIAASGFPGRRVLIEKASAPQLSTLEAFKLVSELPSMGFTRIKMAFVDHSLNSDEVNNFAEMVGNNMGLNARTFDHVHAAERWLLSA